MAKSFWNVTNPNQIRYLASYRPSIYTFRRDTIAKRSTYDALHGIQLKSSMRAIEWYSNGRHWIHRCRLISRIVLWRFGIHSFGRYSTVFGVQCVAVVRYHTRSFHNKTIGKMFKDEALDGIELKRRVRAIERYSIHWNRIHYTYLSTYGGKRVRMILVVYSIQYSVVWVVCVCVCAFHRDTIG